MKLGLLRGDGDLSNAVENALRRQYEDIFVIEEDSVPTSVFLKRRIKRIGVAKVLGQLAFMTLIVPSLKIKSKARIEEIKAEYALDTKQTNDGDVRRYRVESINSFKTKEIIQKEKPDIIVVNGTRIIGGDILDALTVPIINMHVGITPKYRGVHGGYWALVNRDKENCGVTIHMVSKGIDTGGIIAQDKIVTTETDNFVTYPYLQVAVGIELEMDVLRKYEETKIIETYQSDLTSKLWSHPTLWEYIVNRVP